MKAKADRRKVKQRTHGSYLNEWQFPHKFSENPLNTVYEEIYLLGADLEYVHRLIKFAKQFRQTRVRIPVGKAPKESGYDLLIEECIRVAKAFNVVIGSQLFLFWMKDIRITDLLVFDDPGGDFRHFADFMMFVSDQIKKTSASSSARPREADPILTVIDVLGLLVKKGRGRERLVTWLLGKLIEHLRLETGKSHTKPVREIIRIVFNKNISAKAAYQREQKFKTLPLIEIPA